jgi:3-methyladenine DNA glycosylase AlkD
MENSVSKTLDMIIEDLKTLCRPSRNDGMTKFRINTDKALGASIPDLGRVAKRMGKDHDFALRLWETEIHEARILASIIDLPDKVTREQMDKWAEDFNSWDLCDQCRNNLFC